MAHKKRCSTRDTTYTQTGVRLPFQPSYSIFDVYDCTWAGRLRSGNWMLRDKRRGHRAATTLAMATIFRKHFSESFPVVITISLILFSIDGESMFIYSNEVQFGVWFQRDEISSGERNIRNVIDGLRIEYFWSTNIFVNTSRFLISRSMIF